MARLCLDDAKEDMSSKEQHHEQGGPWRVFVSTWLREQHETARHQGSRIVHANTDVFGRPEEIDGQLWLSKGLWLRSIQAQ